MQIWVEGHLEVPDGELSKIVARAKELEPTIKPEEYYNDPEHYGWPADIAYDKAVEEYARARVPQLSGHQFRAEVE